MRLLFVGAIWGGAFVFVEFALIDFGPVSIAAWRVFLGAVFMVFMARLSRGRFARDRNTWACIFLVGCLNSALPFFLISWGQQFIGSAETALLMASGTFCSLVVSHFVNHDERINRFRAAGVMIGFLGVLVLVYGDLLDAGLGGIKGQVAVATAGCSYAISSVIARRLSHLPAIPTSAATMMSAAIYMVPLAFYLENPLPANAGWVSLASLCYLGVVATALAMTIRLVIIRINGAVFMSMVGYLVPLFGVAWSTVFFADETSERAFLAMALILAGIAVTRKGN